jgi:hypothetical protein
VVVVELGVLVYDGANRYTILLIRSCCKSIVELPLVHWVASVVFRVPPALGALGILQPLDPSMLLIFILGGVRRTLISRHICM